MKLEDMEGSDLAEYIGCLRRDTPNIEKVLSKAMKELKCTEHELLIELLFNCNY